MAGAEFVVAEVCRLEVDNTVYRRLAVGEPVDRGPVGLRKAK